MGEYPTARNLLQAVVEVLTASNEPLKAREIVARLNRSGDQDELRREVNRLLYGPLAGFARQDPSYRWSLVRTPRFTDPQPSIRQRTATPETGTNTPTRIGELQIPAVDPEVVRRVKISLEEWKKALIEFGRRNKVLYFNTSRRTRLRLLSPDVPTLYEALVHRDKSLSFGTPIKGDIDRAELEDDTTAEGEERERGGDIVVDYSASSASDVRSLQRKLFRLRTDARSTLNEQGINTLHVSLGMLRWRETDTSQEWIESPILLVPALLDREKNGPYRLSAFEGDVVVNPALVHRLRHDFDLEFPSFDPFDGFGEDPDVPGYFAQILRVMRDRGWTVDQDAWLSHFSFQKLVMYEDLSLPTTPTEIASHPVLAAICDVGELDLPEVSFEQIEGQFELPETYPVVDADSSQLEVIARVQGGQSLVVQGPPGTGKSQTIVNLIGQAIRDKKSVLFVSEKRAALEVVHRRLREAGLADLCLELHSHRANKREVVKDLYFAMQGSMESVEAPLASKFEDRRALRRRLDAYVRALGIPRGASGNNAYEMHGVLALLVDTPSIRADLPIPSNLDLSRDRGRSFHEALQRVTTTALWDTAETHPWREAVFDDPPFVVRQSLAPSLGQLNQATTTALSVCAAYREWTGEPPGADTLAGLSDLVNQLRSLALMPLSVHPKWLWCDTAEFASLTSLLRASAEASMTMQARLAELADSKAEPLIAVPDQVLTLATRYRNDYGSFLRRLSRAYRRDRRSLKSVLGRKCGFKDAISLLTAAQSHYEAKSWLLSQQKQIRDGVGRDWPTAIEEIREVLTSLEWAQHHREFLRDGLPSQTAAQRLVEKRVLIASAAPMAAERLRASAEEGLDAARTLDRWFPHGVGGLALAHVPLSTLSARAGEWSISEDRVDEWADYQKAIEGCGSIGLETFLRAARQATVPGSQLEFAFRKIVATNWLTEAYRQDPALGEFSIKGHEETIAEFRRLDRELLIDARKAVRHAANLRQDVVRRAARNASAKGIRERDPAERLARDEFRRVKREYEKKRKHLPLRRLLPEIPTILPAVKPCLLMSPLSVASYLPRDRFAFDLVIFDEASQVLPADAIGAILRGNQLVVLGDSKQLPPTRFFQRHLDGDDSDLEEEDLGDVAAFDSILEISSTALPEAGLRWHYRSRDERLIAFSNRRFYSERPLITFPNPNPEGDTGVRYLYVPDGLYDRGGTRTNPVEARQVVDLIIGHFERHGWQRSLGVIALSINQRDVIELELRRRILERPDLEPFIAETGTEPFFIKNLETVQGDERDEIILSIGYGPSEPGKSPALAFGPVSASGGERRLNVAITRAKYALTLVSSIRPEQLDRAFELQRDGPKVLAEYFRYAARGGRFDVEGEADSTRAPQSPFEEAVLGALRTRGYVVDPQVGASGYRIDLAIRHPDIPTRYILGIECDGAMYHSAASARDRDRLRQEMLEEQGWRIHRIWSTDWIQHRDRSLQAVIDRVELLRTSEPAEVLIREDPETRAATQVEPRSAPPIHLQEIALLPAPFLEEQREALLFEVSRLEQQVTSLRESHGMLGAQPDKGFTDDQVERALEQRLDQVRGALRRIEAGTYGRCQKCGRVIETERLEAVPSTPLCRECAQRTD